MSDQNDKKPRLTAEGKFALIAILCASPLFVFFAYLGDPGRGMGASCCACILLFAVRTCWESRKHLWFWITVLIMTGIQIPFVLYDPWSNQHYRGGALLPIQRWITASCGAASNSSRS